MRISDWSSDVCSSDLPTGQIGTVADVVSAALYICSAYGAYFSGSTMTIDGGENLRHSLGGPPFSAPRPRMLNRPTRDVRACKRQRRVDGGASDDERNRGSCKRASPAPNTCGRRPPPNPAPAPTDL